MNVLPYGNNFGIPQAQGFGRSIPHISFAIGLIGGIGLVVAGLLSHYQVWHFAQISPLAGKIMMGSGGALLVTLLIGQIVWVYFSHKRGAARLSAELEEKEDILGDPVPVPDPVHAFEFGPMNTAEIETAQSKPLPRPPPWKTMTDEEKDQARDLIRGGLTAGKKKEADKDISAKRVTCTLLALFPDCPSGAESILETLKVHAKFSLTVEVAHTLYRQLFAQAVSPDDFFGVVNFMTSEELPKESRRLLVPILRDG